MTLFIELQGLIAKGDFSTVRVAQREGDADVTAVKCFSREQVRTNVLLSRRVESEKYALGLLSTLPHPYVIRYLYTHYDAERLLIGMEYPGGCDVFTLLQNKGSLSPDWARSYAAEVTLALGHIHSFNLIFRDLRPENVLIGADGHTKLTGFGCALEMSGCQDGQVEPPPAHIVSLNGTPEFLAPEILLGNPTSEVSDWWSFGCFVAEMLTGSSPFAEEGQDIKRLVERILHVPIDAPMHPHVGSSEVSLLEALLVRDPNDRLGARPQGQYAVLAHKWFSGVSAAELVLRKLPVPWLPHLDGPSPEAKAEAEAEKRDEPSGDAETSGHAQGALTEATYEQVDTHLAEEIARPPAVLAGWGERANVVLAEHGTSAPGVEHPA